MPRPALIIEDDPDIAESVRYNLEAEGFPAMVASTGEQGLELALDAQNPPMVIILDLMLPGISGTELCRRLRQKLGRCGNCIETVVGVGYRFVGCASQSRTAPSSKDD